MWSACIQIWTEGLVLDRPYSSYFWTLRCKILKLQIFSRTFVVINLLQLIIHGQNQNSKIGLRKNRFVWNFELIVIYFCWKKFSKNWSLPRACSYTLQEKLDLLLRLIFWKKNLFSMVLETIFWNQNKYIFQKSSEIEIIKFWASFMTSTLIFW